MSMNQNELVNPMSCVAVSHNLFFTERLVTIYSAASSVKQKRLWG